MSRQHFMSRQHCSCQCAGRRKKGRKHRKRERKKERERRREKEILYVTLFLSVHRRAHLLGGTVEQSFIYHVMLHAATYTAPGRRQPVVSIEVGGRGWRVDGSDGSLLF